VAREFQAPPGESQLSSRRKWLATALGVAAVAAMVAGVVVFASDAGSPTVAHPLAVPVGSPADSGAGDTAAPPAPGPVQRPGTVLLPAGGMARLVRKEVTSDAILPIPRGLEDAAWWGAALGADHGAALFSGHVNWAGNKGPFDELWSIRAGQDISVVDTAGGPWRYRVTSVVTVRKDDLPAQAPRLFGQDGPHRLVLVTCGGDYVGGTDGYRDNRVVTAQLLSRP
jgi:hypothetical protein